MQFVSPKIIAACFGLSAFAVAIISGIAVGNSIAHVLVRALISSSVCYPIGIIVGMVCARVVAEQVEKMTSDASKSSRNPLGSSHSTSGAEAIADEQPIIV